MPADALTRLSRWYAAHCDGEREHHHGITLTSLDNPGWWMKVDLSGTELATRDFPRVSEGVIEVVEIGPTAPIRINGSQQPQVLVVADVGQVPHQR